jgi:hypothetical protein
MWVYSTDAYCQPTEEGFHEDCEEEWGECVSLEGASLDGEWDGVSVYSHIVCAGGRI